jgi:hypothetical protein
MSDKYDIIIDYLKLLEKKIDNIELNIININNNNKTIENDCSKLREHIKFVENTYDIIREPLGFVKNKIEYIMGKNAKTNLPVIECNMSNKESLDKDNNI